MKTFVKVDKRLKKGVKSHGIWASHIDQGRFFARLFFIPPVKRCCLMLVGGWYLGGRARARSKNTPFESGIDSVGSARLRLSAKFYLVAMFFVIFDVEALYLYAWSTSIRESGWVGFVEAAIFILVLLAGLVYLVRIGALDWTPARSRRTLVNPETDSPTNRHMQ